MFKNHFVNKKINKQLQYIKGFFSKLIFLNNVAKGDTSSTLICLFNSDRNFNFFNF